jgi:hypothetical protein
MLIALAAAAVFLRAILRMALPVVRPPQQHISARMSFLLLASIDAIPNAGQEVKEVEEGVEVK